MVKENRCPASICKGKRYVRNGMATTQTKYFGYGTLIVSISILLVWFAGRSDFKVDFSSNLTCSGDCINPIDSDCVGYFNITSLSKKFYIKNKGDMNLPFTEPEKVKSFQIYKADLRYKTDNPNRWKPINLSKGFTLQVNQTNEFRINLCKNSPEDDIKYGVQVLNINEDPIFFGDWNITKICIWRNETQNIYGNATYEYTCLTSRFNFTLNPKVAYCYGNKLNSTGQYPIIYSHWFDYGYLANKTIYWNQWEKIGEEVIQICDKWTGVWINGKKLDWYKNDFMCSRPETKTFECDNCGSDGNCDGIWSSGETGGRITLINGTLEWNFKGDTPNLKKIIQRFKIET